MTHLQADQELSDAGLVPAALVKLSWGAPGASGKYEGAVGGYLRVALVGSSDPSAAAAYPTSKPLGACLLQWSVPPNSNLTFVFAQSKARQMTLLRHEQLQLPLRGRVREDHAKSRARSQDG